MHVDLVERGHQPLAAFAVERSDTLAQAGDRLGEVFALARERLQPLFGLGRLGLGDEIDRTHPVTLALKALEQREAELYWAVHEVRYPSRPGDDAPDGKAYDSMDALLADLGSDG